MYFSKLKSIFTFKKRDITAGPLPEKARVQLQVSGHSHRPITWDNPNPPGTGRTESKPAPLWRGKLRKGSDGGAMDAEVEEGGQPQQRHTKHIKKRAIRNKALAVSFNEKDLRFAATFFFFFC